MTQQAKPKANQQLEEKLKAVKAKDMMTKTVVTTTPQAHLADLADEIIKHRISGMPVVDSKGKLCGVVTMTDLLVVMGMVLEGSAVEDDGMTPTVNPKVNIAMSSDVVTIRPETTLDEIVKIMRNKGIHTIPIMDGDKLAGVVGKHDVLKKFYEVIRKS